MRNLHREPLGGGMEIYVTDSYHFSTDTILLANFANRRGGRRRVDLGRRLRNYRTAVAKG